MKLVTFTHQGSTRIGVVNDDAVADVCAASSSLPREMIALLSGGREMLEEARRAAESAPRLPLAQVKLEAPLRHPPEFLAVGLNYADHIAETGMRKADLPDLLQQAIELRERALRPDPSAAGFRGARLRG